MQTINSGSLGKIFEEITHLEDQINLIKEKKADRLIVLPNGEFKSVTKNQPGARNQLENSIEQINRLLMTSLRSLTTGEQPDGEQVQQLNKKIVNINKWVVSSVNSYKTQHSSFWRYIPILKWFTHTISESKINDFHATTQAYSNVLSRIQAEHEKISSSRQFTLRLLETVASFRDGFVNTIQTKSNVLRENGFITFHQVLIQGGIELKSVADQTANQFRALDEDLRQSLGKNKITNQDFWVCRAALNEASQEINKVTDYFIKRSLNDEMAVFFSAWADQKLDKTDTKASLESAVNKNLSLAKEIFKDCWSFIAAIKSKNVEQPKVMAVLILSYARILELVQDSKKSLEQEMALVSEGSLQYKIDQLTNEIYTIQQDSNDIVQKMRDFSPTSKEYAYLKTVLSKNSSTITTKNASIKRIYDNKQASERAKKIEIDNFEKDLSFLTQRLKEMRIVGPNNELIGEVTLNLTSYIIEGKYKVAAVELQSIAEVYNVYIESLKKLQKQSKEMGTAFSQLKQLIEKSAFTPKYELVLDTSLLERKTEAWVGPGIEEDIFQEIENLFPSDEDQVQQVDVKLDVLPIRKKPVSSMPATFPINKKQTTPSSSLKQADPRLFKEIEIAEHSCLPEPKIIKCATGEDFIPLYYSENPIEKLLSYREQAVPVGNNKPSANISKQERVALYNKEKQALKVFKELVEQSIIFFTVNENCGKTFTERDEHLIKFINKLSKNVQDYNTLIDQQKVEKPQCQRRLKRSQRREEKITLQLKGIARESTPTESQVLQKESLEARIKKVEQNRAALKYRLNHLNTEIGKNQQAKESGRANIKTAKFLKNMNRQLHFAEKDFNRRWDQTQNSGD